MCPLTYWEVRCNFRTVAIALLLAVAIVQIGIAIGVVPPTITWKSSFDSWSWQLAGLSVLAASILLGMVWILHHHRKFGTIAVGIYMTLNTLGNLTSKSPAEKYGMGTTTAVVALCCFFAARHSWQDDGGRQPLAGRTNRSNPEYGTIQPPALSST